MSIGSDEIIKLMKKCGIEFSERRVLKNADLTEMLDSLDMANLLLALEENYNILIPDEKIKDIANISAMVDFINSKS